MANRQVQVVLSVVPDAAQRRADAFKDVTAELEKQQKALDRINASLRPDVVRQRARLQLDTERAQRELDRQIQAERGRLDPTSRLTGLLSGLTSGGAGGLAQAVGGAAAGPAAAAIAAVGAAIAAAHVAARAAAAPLNAAAAGLRELSGELGPLGIGFALGESLPIVGRVYGAFRGLTLEMVRLAGAAHPVAFQRFQFAVQDVAAVVGRVFVPVLEVATKAVRLIGDVLATVLPSSAEMRRIFAELDPVFAELRNIAVAVAPALRELTRLLASGLTAALRVATAAFQELMKVLSFTPAGLAGRGLARLLPGGGLGSSVDAAPRPASFVGLEELSRQIALSTFSAGFENQRPEERTANALDRIETMFRRLLELANTAGDPLGIRAAVLRGLRGF